MKRDRGLSQLVLVASVALLAACAIPRATPTPARLSVQAAPSPTAAASTAPAPSMTLAAPATTTQSGTASVPAAAAPAPTMTATPVPTATQPPAPTRTATSGPAPTHPPTPTQVHLSTETSTPSPAATARATAAGAASPPVRPLAELRTSADDLAFSPDGRWLAVGGGRYESDAQFAVEVWEVASGRLRWAGRHTDLVRKVAFSPDGTHVGSVSFDNSARLWDAATGALVAELTYDYWVYGLDFSVEGNRWATGSLDGKAVVADASSGKVLGEFKHDLMVIDLALAPDGPWLAALTSGSWGPGRVTVWDVRTHEQRVLADFNGVASGNVVFSPDTRWLAAPLGYSGQIAIWQTQIWAEVARLSTPQGSVSRLIFSPNGQRLAALIQGGETQNQVVVWDVPAWRVAAQSTLDDVGWDIAFSPDGWWLAAGLGQGIEHPAAFEAQLWDVAGGELAARMPHLDQVMAVAFSGDGKLIATGSHSAVKLWELRAGR